MTSGLWCDAHWKPFGAKKANGIMATVLLMARFTHDERIPTEMMARADEFSKLPPAEQWNRLTTEHAPICCWLPAATIEALLIIAKEAEDYDHTLEGPPLAAAQSRAFQRWQARAEAS